MMNSKPSLSATQPVNLRETPGCRLWIDGVGCWLLWSGDELTFGNATPLGRGEFRFRILSDLQTQHGCWQHQTRSDWFLPHGSTKLNGVEIHQKTGLISSDMLQLGSSVELEFRRPNPLSASSVMTVRSGHRSCDFFDGVLLFRQVGILGAEEQHHIRCCDWQQSVVLFETDGNLQWRLQNSDAPAQFVQAGEIIGEEEWRIRFEPIY